LLLIAIGLDMAGFESCSDFLMEQPLRVGLYAMPIAGLILGLLGHLPGTKEKKPSQASAKSAFVDLRIRLAFMPLIGHWFAPDKAGNDKRDDG
jgi:hypothetical protein